jgi:hypothetical protein
MSLAIDIDAVTAVLLADGWHEVIDDSFYLDAYEFLESPKPEDPNLDRERRGHAAWDSDAQTVLGGGQQRLVPATGFSFQTEFTDTICWLSGPLTSILAVRTSARR